MFVPKFIVLAVVGWLGLAVFAAPVKHELAPSKRELLEAVVPTPKLQRRIRGLKSMLDLTQRSQTEISDQKNSASSSPIVP